MGKDSAARSSCYCDRVEIGANCAIDRGALDDTVIEDDVIIDNLVHIAHGVRIGRQSAVAGRLVLPVVRVLVRDARWVVRPVSQGTYQWPMMFILAGRAEWHAASILPGITHRARR